MNGILIGAGLEVEGGEEEVRDRFGEGREIATNRWPPRLFHTNLRDVP